MVECAQGSGAGYVRQGLPCQQSGGLAPQFTDSASIQFTGPGTAIWMFAFTTFHNGQESPSVFWDSAATYVATPAGVTVTTRFGSPSAVEVLTWSGPRLLRQTSLVWPDHYYAK
jgi:hypothetical protein